MRKILLPMLVLVMTLGGCASKSCLAGIIPKRVQGSGNVVEEQRHVRDFDEVHLAGLGNLIIALGDEEADFLLREGPRNILEGTVDT